MTTDPIAIRKAALEEAATEIETEARKYLAGDETSKNMGHALMFAVALVKMLHQHPLQMLEEVMLIDPPPSVQPEGWRSDMEAISND